MSKIILNSKDVKEILRRFLIEAYITEKEKKKKSNKLCARGISAAKAKYDVYPSAYANGYAVQVCKGKMPGLDGKKRCSGSYCGSKK